MRLAAESIGGRRVSLEQLRGRPLLLKFYRFATCPVCNLHMHQFILDYQKIEDGGLTTVVFYHSPADKLADAQEHAPPFDLVPDPAKEIFKAYRVAQGNPADFIIDSSGRVAFAHYGKHYADSLDAADVVEAWQDVRRLQDARRDVAALC